MNPELVTKLRKMCRDTDSWIHWSEGPIRDNPSHVIRWWLDLGNEILRAIDEEGSAS